MHFTPWQPDAPWADQVEAVFHYSQFIPDHHIERVVPTGHVYILFAFDGIQRAVFDNATLTPVAHFRDVWVAGVHRDHLSISAHPDSEMLVVQFAHTGAHAFLHRPVELVADRVWPGDAWFDGTLPALHAAAQAAPSVEEKFRVIGRWLDERFAPHRVAPAPLQSVVDRLVADPSAPLSEATASYGYSQKHLAAQCKTYVGLTPKAFHRLLRCAAVVARLHDKRAWRWADLAQEGGFSDQSHLIRELREFSGFTPERLRALGFDEDQVNFFALDRRDPGPG